VTEITLFLTQHMISVCALTGLALILASIAVWLEPHFLERLTGVLIFGTFIAGFLWYVPSHGQPHADAHVPRLLLFAWFVLAYFGAIFLMRAMGDTIAELGSKQRDSH
jgi:protein-S-isoprenylcysteine O-methyltransferase Ste14